MPLKGTALDFWSIWVVCAYMRSVMIIQMARQLASLLAFQKHQTLHAKFPIALDVTCKLFLPAVIPAMPIGTVDFLRSIPLSVALTMFGDHKVNEMQTLLASFPHTLSNWSGETMKWRWSNSSWKTSFYFWVRVIESREALFLDGC